MPEPQKKQWTDLHHEVLGLIKKHNFENSLFLVACSGGLDSVAGFHLLQDLQMKIELCHVHHGGSSSFRKKSHQFVQRLAAQNQVKFHYFQSPQELLTENEMRNFRRGVWSPFLKTHVVTLSHQKDDLLETRMMRLIRGTGPDGIQAMAFYQGSIFRPLLGITKKELENYLVQKKQTWLEDPSNLDTRYFRNFLRQKWFLMLEKQKPGSLSRLAESLENLSHVTSSIDKTMVQISMPDYLSLSSKEQLQVLALLLKNNGLTEFGLSQLKEIQKQLDKQQKRHTFKCAGAQWVVNAQQISLEK